MKMNAIMSEGQQLIPTAADVENTSHASRYGHEQRQFQGQGRDHGILRIKDGWRVNQIIEHCDENGVYCPGVLLRVHPSFVIKYIGWNEKWDEDVNDPASITNIGTHVKRVKCWANISKEVGYWPSVVFIRSPANEDGIQSLKKENNVFVVPCGQYFSKLNKMREGFWLHTQRVHPFHQNYDKYCQEGLASDTSDYFVSALVDLDDSGALEENFEFIGSFNVLSSPKSSSSS